jgi:hypothetical protein
LNLPKLPNTVLVGVGHRARHGKDTVAKFIIDYCQRRGIDARRYAFADALYTYCMVTHDMREKDPVLLQNVGVEMRGKNPNVWIETMFWQMAKDPPEVAVIPDTRFLNEGDAIHYYGGALIKVERHNPDGTLFVDPSRPADHISETEGDGIRWDAKLHNNAGLVALKLSAQTLLDQILLRRH